MNEKRPITTLGLWFKDHRKRLGLTQQEVAEIVGVGHRTISSWEQRQTHRPSRRFLPTLAQLFDVSLSEIQIVAGYGEGTVIYDAVITNIKPVVTKFCRGCDTCDACGRCKWAIVHGLPILCESVTERDIQAARARGLEEELIASRRL